MHTLNRRQLLALGAVLLTPVVRVLAIDNSNTSPLYVSAATTNENTYFLMGFRHDGGRMQPVFKLQLPERGHHIAINAQRGFLVSVARRPGTSLVLVDLATGQLIRELQVPADRHLYGHGVFSNDGSLFYTTENAFDDTTESSGRLVVWAVQGAGSELTLQRLQEFPSGGIGPHELILMPDGNTLAIANGGIRTHPSHDRDILNLDSMRPSLAYVDRHSGKLLEQRFLPEQFHQSSIRHLDVSTDGAVVLGMQFEGDAFTNAPLVATHARGQQLQLLMAPEEIQSQLKQYVGAIRFDTSGRYAAASCPRGNQLTIWDTHTGTLLKVVRARDNCGVQATDKGFVFSSGVGKLAELDLATGEISEFEGAEKLALLWDNHLVVADTGNSA